MSELIKLAERVVDVLDKKASAGVYNKEWKGFTNGNGTEVGVDIDRLIKHCKKIINTKK